ncbi:MAG: hypothetical protein ACKVID_02495 [Gammaproteobacteria bacterium]|jgi:hypothetical protein|tara:strand:+ start:336 stop:731 length:396 start_codon:yes stop_codon:yes gene_type:complete
MSRLIKFSLALIAGYLAMQTAIAIFFYETISLPLQSVEFSQEQITEYRARVIIPAFFLTLIYFIYRYFVGKNPTSALWPIYVANLAFLSTQIIGFITFLPISTDGIIMFLITLFMLFTVRKAHNQRKKEFF